MRAGGRAGGMDSGGCFARLRKRLRSRYYIYIYIYKYIYIYIYIDGVGSREPGWYGRFCDQNTGLDEWLIVVRFPVGVIQLDGESSILFNGQQSLFQGIKRPGRETDHSPPFSAVVKALKVKREAHVPLKVRIRWVLPFAFMACKGQLYQYR